MDWVHMRATMTSVETDPKLPKPWKKVQSRRHPTLFYYFNSKTKQTTWIHPSMIEEAKTADSEKKTKTSKKIGTLKNTFASVINDASNKQEELSNESTKKDDSYENKIISSETKNKIKPKQKQSYVISKGPVMFNLKGKSTHNFGKDLEDASQNLKNKPAKTPPSTIKVQNSMTAKAKWTSKESEIENRLKRNKKKHISSSTKNRKEADEGDRKKEGDTEATSPRIDRKQKKREKREKKDKELLEQIIAVINESPVRDEVKESHAASNNKGDQKKRDLYGHFIQAKTEKKVASEGQEKLVDAISPSVSKAIQVQKELSRREELGLNRKRRESSQRLPSYSSSYNVEHPGKSIADTDHRELSEQPSQYDTNDKEVEETDMEIDEQEVITEITNFRGEAQPPAKDLSQLLTSSVSADAHAIYFVVDTNVLICDLKIVQSLRWRRVSGKEAVVVVPYRVLQEMDGLKKQDQVGARCKAAIGWCNSHFEIQDPLVQGQSYDSYLHTLATSETRSGDDLIRDCCLMLRKEGLEVCLLTNDINLQNKAFMSNLDAFGVRKLKARLQKEAEIATDNHLLSPKSSSHDHEVMHMNVEEGCGFSSSYFSISDRPDKMMVSDRRSSDLQMEDRDISSPKRAKVSMLIKEEQKLIISLVDSLHKTLSDVLQFILKDIYHELWLKIVKHKPPWSTWEVFDLWEKHWIAIMSDKFPREMKTVLVHLGKTVTKNREIIKIDKLEKQVMLVYSFLKPKYQRFIKPLRRDCVGTGNSEPQGPSVTASLQPPGSSMRGSPVVEAEQRWDGERGSPSTVSPGVSNAEKMIDQVGTYITHYIAMVLEALGVETSLPHFHPRRNLNLDNAHTSAHNLHQTIMRLGSTMVVCLNDPSSVVGLQELGTLLTQFWSDAQESCPVLPFTVQDLGALVSSPACRQYLTSAITELEKLLSMLATVLKAD